MDKRNKENNKNKRNNRSGILALILILALIGAAVYIRNNEQGEAGNGISYSSGGENEYSSPESGGSGENGSAFISDIQAGDLPEWNGSNYIDVNGGVPEFPEEVYTKAGLDPGDLKGEPAAYEYYGELDSLGRCTAAYGCLGEETMPGRDEERGDISSVHPSGWAKAQHWERCHLIAWALGAENANERNLVTGTHYLNYDGMRPLEEEVEHYIWKTGRHVLYMTEPVFAGDELVPRGVHMMAMSAEDGGRGVSFNVYCFNVTPGAGINYNTGIVTTEEQASREARLYVVNKRSKVFHYPTCEGARSISGRNRMEITATRSELTEQGYIPCGYCEP